MTVGRNKIATTVAMVFSLTFLTVFGGCADKCQQQLDEMTLQNQDLNTELEVNQEELQSAAAQLAQCQDALANAQLQVGQLRRQASAKPKLPEGWQARKGMVMTSLPESVLFSPGKEKLKDSAKGKLNKVMAQIRNNWPGKDVYIIGHTDSDPIRKSKWADNLELSLQRSAAVTRYLIKQGMSAKKLIAAGCGPHRPIDSNSTASGKSRNRRVEFWVLKST